MCFCVLFIFAFEKANQIYKLPYVKKINMTKHPKWFQKRLFPSISQVKLWNPTFRNPPTRPIKVPIKGHNPMFPGGSISDLQSFSHFSPKTTQTLFQDLGEMTPEKFSACFSLEKGEHVVKRGDDFIFQPSIFQKIGVDVISFQSGGQKM